MQIFRTTWGLVGPDAPWPRLNDFIQDAAVEGYDGVEFPIAHLDFEDEDTARAVSKVKDALDETGLKVIALIATRPQNWGDEVGHLQDFRRQLAHTLDLGAKKAAVHCGADSFDHHTAVRFLSDILLISADSGLTPCIETHRGRPLNDPWRTAKLLEAIPHMKLTSDLSHWHVVVDREPTDIMDLFDEASRRTGHLHARVGHEKGAQVPHPADPDWADHVTLYKRWWTISRDAALARGEAFTVTPEFGPPPYMNTRPFTHERDADLIELNKWMRERLTDWFGSDESRVSV